MAENWDKFVDSAKDFAGTVAGAAEDLYGKGKDYFNLKRLEHRLREKYRALGRLQYKIETNEEVAAGEKEELINAISELRKEIQEGNGSDVQEEEIVCEACGSAIPGDAKFCPGCGVQL